MNLSNRSNREQNPQTCTGKTSPDAACCLCFHTLLSRFSSCRQCLCETMDTKSSHTNSMTSVGKKKKKSTSGWYIEDLSRKAFQLVCLKKKKKNVDIRMPRVYFPNSNWRTCTWCPGMRAHTCTRTERQDRACSHGKSHRGERRRRVSWRECDGSKVGSQWKISEIPSS